jgi:hypothetical protein
MLVMLRGEFIPFSIRVDAEAWIRIFNYLDDQEIAGIKNYHFNIFEGGFYFYPWSHDPRSDDNKGIISHRFEVSHKVN